MKIGILALQGAFAEHIAAFSALHTIAVPVRLPSELDCLDALVIPGGESTSISKLMSDYGLTQPTREMAKQGFPIFGTCAGMVLLAQKLNYSPIEPLGLMDIQVKRNAFGRQVNSFEADLTVPILGNETFRGIFIRAPIVEKVGPDVAIMCKVYDHVVAVRQGKILACAFHPELTEDLRFHKYFLSLVSGEAIAKNDR